MLPHEHVVISTMALPTAAALIGRRHAALFWVGAVLVDVDHYIWFVGASGSWRPTGALRFFRQHYHDPAGRHAAQAGTRHRRVLHGFPFWVLVWSLSAWLPALRAVAAGLAFHWLLDVLNGFLRGEAPPGTCAAAVTTPETRVCVSMPALLARQALS